MNKGRIARLVGIALVTAGMVVVQPAHAGEPTPSVSEKGAAPGSAAFAQQRTKLAPAPGKRAAVQDDIFVSGPASASIYHGAQLRVFRSVFNDTTRQQWVEQKTWNPTTSEWGAWENIGAPSAGLSTMPTASWASPGRLDLFVTGGADGHLYQRTFDVSSGWGRWVDLGGVLLTSPSAVWANNRLDVFGIGTDRRMYQKTWNAGSGWTGWGGFDGPSAGNGSSPAVTGTINGKRLDVFVRGTSDGRVYQKVWTPTSGWGGWFSLGGVLIPGTAPTASWQADGSRIDVFGIGTDKRLYQKTWSGGPWRDWAGIDAPPAGNCCTPTANWADDASHIDVFVTGREGGSAFQKVGTASGKWLDWVELF